MWYITGDKHGDFSEVEYFCRKNNTTDEDVLVVLGDAGVNYYGNKKDAELKKYLSSLPITFFFVRGNHENRPENVKTYETKSLPHGIVECEKAYPKLIFAKDGEVYTTPIGKIAVIGGAYSVDKFYRLKKNWMWFKDEQLSLEERQKVEENLAKHDWKFDYVFTHTCPSRFIPIEWFLSGVDQSQVDTSTEEWLDSLYDKMEISKKWLCGHYHGQKVFDNVEFLYQSIQKLDG